MPWRVRCCSKTRSGRLRSVHLGLHARAAASGLRATRPGYRATRALVAGSRLVDHVAGGGTGVGCVAARFAIPAAGARWKAPVMRRPCPRHGAGRLPRHHGRASRKWVTRLPRPVLRCWLRSAIWRIGSPAEARTVPTARDHQADHQRDGDTSHHFAGWADSSHIRRSQDGHPVIWVRELSGSGGLSNRGAV